MKILQLLYSRRYSPAISPQLNSRSRSRSRSHFTTGSLRPISSSWRQAPGLSLLLVLASSVILKSDCRGTHDHILLSQIRDSPNLEGQVPVFISPRNRVAWLYPQALGSFSSPPTIRRATVEVFKPASTQDTELSTVYCPAYNISALTVYKTIRFHCSSPNVSLLRFCCPEMGTYLQSRCLETSLDKILSQFLPPPILVTYFPKIHLTN
jgi:hypothetical protein